MGSEQNGEARSSSEARSSNAHETGSKPVPDSSKSTNDDPVARLRAAALQAFGLKRAEPKQAKDEPLAPEHSQALKAKLQAKLRALKRRTAAQASGPSS